MLNSKSLFSILVFTIFALVSLLQGQDNRFITFDYMKVNPGQSDLYLEIEQKIWKPMHQKRMEEGDILGWYLHQVIYPSGSHTEYDYVTITVYDDITQLENQSDAYIELARKIHPNTAVDRLMEKTNQSRDLVKTEVFQIIDLIPSKDSKPAPYMMVNFMKTKPGAAAEYINMEREVYKVWHTTRVEAGRMHSWRVVNRLLPYGSSFEYDYMTGDSYMSFADSGTNNDDLLPKFEAKMASVPNFSMAQMNRMQNLRDLVKADLWALVDYIQIAPNQPVETTIGNE